MTGDLKVIDASLALKWAVNEEHSEEALSLLDELDVFICPEVFYLEIDAVLTKRVRIRELEAQEAKEIKNNFRALPCKLISHSQIDEIAFDLSTSFNISYFDALYLSTALKFNTVVQTADVRFFNALQNTEYKNHIEKLQGV
ncbi:type II toxin-antitoxin system VapC family toxin [Gracilimonas sediminicola]|uniref:Type II toxin-antitoxin system VapC family toxin n=1 Tax=Gracilimonas sediminicola TaxID=2952158 RepID=A0A9X2L3P9_9BACT|nr:type II toxin-antitoxin system VapC family toxin [Gracilimonas sediminicola]